jgi:hypothetical protein
MLIIGGIFASIVTKSEIAGEWKELLLLLLGAFIGSYGKIIDYWFSDTDKDKMLVQKMDEEDGTTLSNTADMPDNPIVPTPVAPLVLPTSAPVLLTEEAAPAEAKKGDTFHIVVEGTDTGSPALTRYRRVVITLI